MFPKRDGFRVFLWAKLFRLISIGMVNLGVLIGVFRANMARNLNSWDLKTSDNYSVR